MQLPFKKLLKVHIDSASDIFIKSVTLELVYKHIQSL